MNIELTTKNGKTIYLISDNNCFTVATGKKEGIDKNGKPTTTYATARYYSNFKNAIKSLQDMAIMESSARTLQGLKQDIEYFNHKLNELLKTN